MNENGKLCSLLFLTGCIMAVWAIALTTVPVQRESYHTGFGIKYAKTAEMETQTEPDDFFNLPIMPDSFETSELYCTHGKCTRTEREDKKEAYHPQVEKQVRFIENQAQQQVQQQIESIKQQSMVATENVNHNIEEVRDNVRELLHSVKVSSFNNDVMEPQSIDVIILGVNKQRIHMGDPFNLEKNLKS
jgi:hypothetical protein